MTILKETEKKMEQTIDHLKQELNALRSGRANPAMLDGVNVEVYGTKMRLKDLASISVPEPRQLLITPFDINNVHEIKKGIEIANFQAFVDGNIVRVPVPEMDEARRKELVKTARQKREEGKIGIRNNRRDGNELTKKSDELTDDMKKGQEKKIQELTDKFCKIADDLTEKKESEIMTV